MEIGIVVDIKNSKAIIELPLKSLCSRCGLCQSKDKKILIETSNELGLNLGNRVKMELKETSGIKAALIVYLIPILFIFLGYFIGLWICSLTNRPSIGIICGIGIFLTAFLIIHICDRKLAKKRQEIFKIVEIIK